MDRDRSVVDGRYIFESKLQGLIRDAFYVGRSSVSRTGLDWIGKTFDDYDEQLHKLLISYLDGPTSDVGTQDETAQARTMGNRV